MKKNEYIIENHPALGDKVRWFSRGKEKQGVIVAAIKIPQYNSNIKNDEWSENIREYTDAFDLIAQKHKEECLASFKNKYRFFNAPLRTGKFTFIIKVKGEKENHKSKLMHPYAKNLMPAE